MAYGLERVGILGQCGFFLQKFWHVLVRGDQQRRGKAQRGGNVFAKFPRDLNGCGTGLRCIGDQRVALPQRDCVRAPEMALFCSLPLVTISC